VSAASAQRALLVWSVAVAAYVLAVFCRTSLSVAGLLAAERFDIGASLLSSFTMLQLLVYAAMQIPVGLLIDRFGPRRLLIVGLAVLTVSQVGFALAASYPAALVARVGVGAGDAAIFPGVLRLVNTWFTPLRIPFMAQLTGFLGQVGAMAAAVPMTLMLRGLGWTGAYLVPVGVAVVLGVLLVAFVHDGPDVKTRSGPPVTRLQVVATLRAVWGKAGTRLGFWTHFTTQFSVTMFALLWGYPFLVVGQGVSSVTAGVLLTLATVSSVVAAPVVARLVAFHPFHRSTLVLTILAAIVTAWTVVLSWPGPAPAWLLVVLVSVIGVGGPASMVGFDYARTFNPPEQLGGATGVVNQGGFVACLLAVVGVGLVLDWRTPDGQRYTESAFTWAMSVQYLLWGLGGAQIVRYRRRARREMRREDAAAYERMRRGLRPGE
jgi:MFS family permease